MPEKIGEDSLGSSDAVGSISEKKRREMLARLEQARKAKEEKKKARDNVDGKEMSNELITDQHGVRKLGEESPQDKKEVFVNEHKRRKPARARKESWFEKKAREMQ